MNMNQEPPVKFDPTPDPNESVGAWLARTRASYDTEPRDMARHLGLNPTIIMALEADDFARLGPTIFVRGYLSRYARLLNLPEAEVLERYQRQVGPSQEPPPLKVVHPVQQETRIHDLRGILYLVAVVGIGWAAIEHLPALNPSSWWRQDGAASVPAPASSPGGSAASQVQYPFQAGATAAVPEASSPAPSATPVTTSQSPPAPDSQTVPPTLAPPPATATPLESMPSSSASVTASAPSSAAPGSTSVVADGASGARLMLQFSEECWVQVKDAQGKILVNGLMKANTTQTLSGPAPFTVTLGNAPAARIALDDRPVDTAVYVPRRGTVSRFTLTP